MVPWVCLLLAQSVLAPQASIVPEGKVTICRTGLTIEAKIGETHCRFFVDTASDESDIDKSWLLAHLHNRSLLLEKSGPTDDDEHMTVSFKDFGDTNFHAPKNAEDAFTAIKSADGDVVGTLGTDFLQHADIGFDLLIWTYKVWPLTSKSIFEGADWVQPKGKLPAGEWSGLGEDSGDASPKLVMKIGDREFQPKFSTMTGISAAKTKIVKGLYSPFKVTEKTLPQPKEMTLSFEKAGIFSDVQMGAAHIRGAPLLLLPDGGENYDFLAGWQVLAGSRFFFSVRSNACCTLWRNKDSSTLDRLLSSYGALQDSKHRLSICKGSIADSVGLKDGDKLLEVYDEEPDVFRENLLPEPDEATLSFAILLGFGQMPITVARGKQAIGFVLAHENNDTNSFDDPTQPGPPLKDAPALSIFGSANTETSTGGLTVAGKIGESLCRFTLDTGSPTSYISPEWLKSHSPGSAPIPEEGGVNLEVENYGTMRFDTKVPAGDKVGVEKGSDGDVIGILGIDFIRKVRIGFDLLQGNYMIWPHADVNAASSDTWLRAMGDPSKIEEIHLTTYDDRSYPSMVVKVGDHLAHSLLDTGSPICVGTPAFLKEAMGEVGRMNESFPLFPKPYNKMFMGDAVILSSLEFGGSQIANAPVCSFPPIMEHPKFLIGWLALAGSRFLLDLENHNLQVNWRSRHVNSLDRALANFGAMVDASGRFIIESSSYAFDQGLRTGDELVEVSGKSLQKLAKLRTSAEKVSDIVLNFETDLPLKYRRAGQEKALTLHRPAYTWADDPKGK